jgi:AraC-like DNA-binding protein
LESNPPLKRFSTLEMPRAQRFDRWMDVLGDSMWRVTDWRQTPRDFNVELSSARLGPLVALSETISAHHSRRTRSDVDNSAERSFHLFVTTGPAWGFRHRGASGRLNTGDVLMLAEGEHETLCPDGFRGVIVKCPEHWMRTWLPEPEAVAGQTIARDSRWGQVLSPILSQMTPELAVAAPLPHQVLVDQVGAMLGLLASDAAGRAMPDLVDRVRACLRERCHEAALTAADIAQSIDVPAQVLHRALGATRSTFAEELLSARVAAALSLLGSGSSRHMTVSAIAQACGFSSAAQLARMLRKRTGRSPVAHRGQAD